MFKEALTYDDIQIIPKYSEISSRSTCELRTKFTKRYFIDKPYVSAPMDTVTGTEMAKRMLELGGVGVINRFMSVDDQIKSVSDVALFSVEFTKNMDMAICAAIGVNEPIKRLDGLSNAGVNVILIDVAHGNTLMMKNAINKIKEIYPHIDIVAGNVATADGARNLCEWGVDGIRVGIGNGSLCETRIRTGIGIPQVTALIDCIKVCDEYGVPVIADGGIRTTGDVAKALALGADSVMLGSLLAGTKESPGSISKTGSFPNEQLYKRYRGSASLETKLEYNLSEKNVEGNSKLIPYKGKIKRIIDDINDGVRSAMSYVNASNLSEFQANSEFIKVTQNGVIEAKPHLL